MATKLRVCQDLSMHLIIKRFLINFFLFRGLASSLKIEWYLNNPTFIESVVCTDIPKFNALKYRVCGYECLPF